MRPSVSSLPRPNTGRINPYELVNGNWTVTEGAMIEHDAQQPENCGPRMTALAGFRQDVVGGFTPFVLMSFLIMMLASGMAIDFMRHEMARADLQNALDRGVLAAADVDRAIPLLADSEDTGAEGAGGTLEASSDASATELETATRALVLDYMKSRSYKAPILNIDVDSPEIKGGRRVTASANYELNTFFLNMMGLDTMIVPASSQAQDNASNVEIALVLDVSASMSAESTKVDPLVLASGGSTSTPTRLTDLKDAAKKFIGEVLTEDNKDRTAISIVPYSAQVNMSDVMAEAYTLDTHHTYGNCIDFSAQEYKDTTIRANETHTQTKHFVDYWSTQYYWKRDFIRYERYWYYGWRWRPVYGPYYREEVNTPLNHLCPTDTNEILAYANDKGALEDAIDALDFEGWTASYTGMKWGVALLDPTSRPLVRHLISKGEVSSDFDGWPSLWSDVNTQKVVILMTDGRNTRQYDFKDSEYAKQSPAYWHANVAPDSALTLNVDNREDGGVGDGYLKDICDAAKQHSNTIIFTVAFELDDTDDGKAAKTALDDCASSEATEYDTNGHNIDTAFLNIAQSIKKLRLTQ